MIGWNFLSNYSPIYSIIFATIYFIFFFNIGNLFKSIFYLEIEEKYSFHTSILLGYLIVSFFNSIFILSNLFILDYYKVILLIFILLSFLVNYQNLIKLFYSLKIIKINYLLLILGILVLIHFLKSISPESRSDELGYHFLVIQRIIEDQYLKFYPLPWEAAVYFQFYWHYNNIISFLFQLPESSKILSFYFNLCSLSLIYTFVFERTKSSLFSLATVILIFTGGYSLMFLNTFGPHSILIYSCLLLFIYVYEFANNRLNSLLLISVIGTVVMSSKATTLLIVSLLFIFILSVKKENILKNALLLGIIPVGFFLPILFWTYFNSGSPFGSLTPFLYSGAYITNEIINTTIAGKSFNDFNFYRIIFDFYYFNPIILFLSIFGIITLKNRIDILLYSIFIIHILFWLIFLPKEQRHLNYFQIFIFLIVITNIYNHFLININFKHYFHYVLIFLSIPWAIMNIWVSQIFIFNYKNEESINKFLSTYTGLYNTYINLNKILPDDAEIYLGRIKNDNFQITYHARAPFYYSPRKIIFYENQLLKSKVENKYLILLYSGRKYKQSPIKDTFIPDRYNIDKLIYKKYDELYYPERTPRTNKGTRLDVEVYKLIENNNL